MALHACRHSFDQTFECFGVDLAHGDVVEEKERTRPTGENIVHAMVHEIAADALVRPAADQECKLDLGANSVGAGDQQPVVTRRKLEDPAKMADVTGRAGIPRRPSEACDGTQAPGGLVDIDAGIAI